MSKQVRHASISQVTQPPVNYPKNIPLDALRSRLVVGETCQATLHTQFLPGDVRPTVVNDLLKIMALKDRLRYENAHYSANFNH